MLNSIKRLLTYRAPNYINYPLAALCFIFAGYLIWRDFIQEKDPTLPIVDPVFYADGSVEFTIIDRPAKGSKREGGSWVLRFDDLIECKEAGPDGICEEFKSNYSVPSFDDPLIIKDLALRLQIDEFVFLKKKEIDRYQNILIFARSHYRPLFKKLFERSARGRTGLNKRRSNEFGFGKIGGWDACKHEREIATNFYQLRHPTKEEVSTGSYAPNADDLNRFYQARGGYNGYRLVNTQGRQIANGSCVDLQRSETNPFIPCTFSAWIPQERRIALAFERQHLEKFPEIYQNLVEFFNDATVVGKSKNLNWRPLPND